MPGLSKSTNGYFHSAIGQRVERRLSWTGGAALLSTPHSQGESSRRFLRGGFSIGIITIRRANSETRWWLGGRLVLDKKGASTSASLDLIAVPPRWEYQGNAHGNTQELWLFIDSQRPLGDEKPTTWFAEKAMTDSTWSKDPLARAIVFEIAKECSSGGPRGSLFLETSTMVLITQLARHFGATRNHSGAVHALGGRDLRAVIDYFESNVNRNVALSEVSDLIGFEPRYFCAAFKHATGIPPHQFQIGLRIDRAKVLLRDSALSLENVASAVGFRSRSHLTNCFRRKTGFAPTHYRAEMRLRSSLLSDCEEHGSSLVVMGRRPF